jgi:hypothetical protein
VEQESLGRQRYSPFLSHLYGLNSPIVILFEQ